MDDDSGYFIGNHQSEMMGRIPNVRSQSFAWISRRNEMVKQLTERRYVVLAAEPWEDLGRRMQASNPERFKYFNITWSKFPDGMDDIHIDGFSPVNNIAGEHVIFLASFHNNDVTLSQFSVFIVLLQSFIESFTIVLPYFPVGTNERVEQEGRIATANTYCMLLSSLPTVGRPNRIMIYDIHTLQNRFYFHSSTVPSLHSAIPILVKYLEHESIDAICFPDDGAAKRFRSRFASKSYEIIICGKVRDGDKRKVYIQDGATQGKHVLIVDDLVQTGGTLFECAAALRERGAVSVNAFVTHPVFPREAWKQFSRRLNGPKAIFDKFFVTNSIPTVVECLPTDDCFVVLDLMPQIVYDLDNFSA